MGKFSKGLDMTSKLAGIAVPIVIAFFAQSYTSTKDSADQKARRIDRAASLLPHLASKDQSERIGAMTVIRALQKMNEFPGELIGPLTELQTTYPDSKEAQVATQVLAIAKEDKTLAPVVKQAAEVQPATIFIHVRTASQKQDAETIATALKQRGYTVPSIQVVPFGPNRSELRFFHSNESDEAGAIAGTIQAAGLPAVPADASETFRNYSLAPHRYELWFAENAGLPPASPAGKK
jgi:hypothetical protein